MVQIYPTYARKILGLAKNTRVPAEKYSYRNTKKANMFKAKRLIVTSNRCPGHLNRQFLTIASTFPYSSKNSSAEQIHAFFIHIPVSVSVRVWVSVCECVSVYVFRVSVCVHVSECVCVFIYVSECVCDGDHVDEAWICSAAEFLELYGKVEAVVRNCLLR